MPRSARWAAAARPTGPAPMTTTGRASRAVLTMGLLDPGRRGQWPLSGAWCGVHAQQPCWDATAAALAVLPQQDPSATASAAVPQHGPAAASTVSGSVGVACGGVPQQPPVPAAVSTAVGSPLNAPGVCEVLMVVLLRVSGNRGRAGQDRVKADAGPADTTAGDADHGEPPQACDRLRRIS